MGIIFSSPGIWLIPLIWIGAIFFSLSLSSKLLDEGFILFNSTQPILSPSRFHPMTWIYGAAGIGALAIGAPLFSLAYFADHPSLVPATGMLFVSLIRMMRICDVDGSIFECKLWIIGSLSVVFFLLLFETSSDTGLSWMISKMSSYFGTEETAQRRIPSILGVLIAGPFVTTWLTEVAAKAWTAIR